MQAQGLAARRAARGAGAGQHGRGQRSARGQSLRKATTDTLHHITSTPCSCGMATPRHKKASLPRNRGSSPGADGHASAALLTWAAWAIAAAAGALALWGVRPLLPLAAMAAWAAAIVCIACGGIWLIGFALRWWQRRRRRQWRAEIARLEHLEAEAAAAAVQAEFNRWYQRRQASRRRR